MVSSSNIIQEEEGSGCPIWLLYGLGVIAVGREWSKQR